MSLDPASSASWKRPSVSAVILAHSQPEALVTTVEHTMGEPVDEILVVDNSGHGIARRVLEGQASRVRIVDAEGNIGIAGRNLAAGMAAGDLLLMLDQDSYPLPGAVDAMIDIFGAKPRTGVVGGMVLDIDSLGVALSTGREPGSFDWFLRPRVVGYDGVSDSPAFFFPEGASMIRREAYLGIGGYFEPYFFAVEGLELATRMLVAGWDVRYLPQARFHHVRNVRARTADAWTLRHRVRNQLWYYALRFPSGMAMRRIPAYLAFDLLECVYRGCPTAWARGVTDAIAGWPRVRAARHPVPPDVARRAEMARGRRHLELLAIVATRTARSCRAPGRLRRQ